MKVYELIQRLCQNEPNAEVCIRVDGDNGRFQEYIDDAAGADLSATQIWATVYSVPFDKFKSIVFIDCDLERL